MWVLGLSTYAAPGSFADYLQIVTLSLISLSYRYHFTYAGIAVYITHDISDFFLAVSRTLRLAQHNLGCRC